MDLTPYVDSLRHDLIAAAAAGGAQTAEAAERLTMALDAAARLALMDALSEAAAQITAEMADGGVDVRLRGRELEFVVHQTPPQAGPEAADTAPISGDLDDEGETARISLRLPEQIKARAEERAAAAGQSLNSWLVAAIRAATRDSAINVDIDLSSIPFLGDAFGGRGRGHRRMTGWI